LALVIRIYHDARSSECQNVVDMYRHFSSTLMLETVSYSNASAPSYQLIQHLVPETETNLLAFIL